MPSRLKKSEKFIECSEVFEKENTTGLLCCVCASYLSTHT